MTAGAGGEDGSQPREVFASQLKALFGLAAFGSNQAVATRANGYAKAGRVAGLTGRQLDGSYRPVSGQRLSEWQRGDAVPASWAQLAAVLTVLVEAARGRDAGRADLSDLGAWRRWWQQAAASAKPGPDLERPAAASRTVGQWDPFALDVHPAITIDGAAGAQLPQLPGYLPRRHDAQLDQLLAVVDRHSTMIMLTGGSSTGKTRAMYEAVRRHDRLRGWPLIYPRTGAQVLGLLQDDGLVPGSVLWLNEAQGHLLTPVGEDVAAGLRRLLDGSLPGPVVVLGSLWPQYWDQLTATPPAGQPDQHPQARQLLHHQAHRVRVPDTLSQDEITALTNRPEADRRVATAVRTAGTARRVIQVLAGGPVLVDRYQHPDTDTARYATAVLTAAIDVRRLGYTAPVRGPLLAEAARGYLDPDQLDDPAPDTWTDIGLAVASDRVHGIRALTPYRDPPIDGPISGYQLHDYLDQHGRTTRYWTPAPAITWDALLHHITDPNLALALALAEAARDRLLYQYAEQFYRRLTAIGDTAAAGRLADLLAKQGRVDEAIDQLRELVASGDTDAAWQLADLLAEQGRIEELRELAAAGDTAAARRLVNLLAEHGRVQELRELVAAGDTFAAGRLAALLAEQGRVEEAIEQLRELAAAGDTAAAWRLADLLAEQGRVDELRELVAAGDTFAAGRLAALLAEQGRVEEAIEQLRELVAAGDISIFTAGRLANLLARQSRVDELRELAAAGDTAAARQLAALLVRQGRVEEAIDLLRELVVVGDTAAAWRWSYLLTRQGRVDEVIDMLREWAAGGHTAAARWLAKLFAEQGRVEEAIELLRELIGGGDTGAARQLAALFAEQGRVEEAIDQLRELAAGGDTGAALRLADLLAEQGRIEEAIDQLRELAASGHTLAAGWLADLLAEQGRVEELRERAAAGDTAAAGWLADLLARQGRVEELRELAAGGDTFATHRLANLLAEQDRVKELRELAAAGDTAATRRLANLLAEQGRLDEAIDQLRELAAAGDTFAARRLVTLLAQQDRVQELRERAAAGDTAAGGRLADLLARQGRVEELRELAAAGDTAAARWLADLLAQQGRLDEAQALKRFGLNPDATTRRTAYHQPNH